MPSPTPAWIPTEKGHAWWHNQDSGIGACAKIVERGADRFIVRLFVLLDGRAIAILWAAEGDDEAEARTELERRMRLLLQAMEAA